MPATCPPLGDSGWGAVPDRDAIRKIWKFKSFSEAWGFMSRAALGSREAESPPREWSNVYNVVDVTLTTHDAGGLSALDVTLAQRLDRIAGAVDIVRDHSEPIACLCEEHARQKGAAKAP